MNPVSYTHLVGVFFFGHTGLDDVGAVGRVVAFGQ